MARGCTADAAGSRANARKFADPPSTTRVRAPLRTLDDVKVELARLYREAKSGKRGVADASRLGNLLSILGRMIEGADLERRIEAIEQAQKEQSACAGRRH